MDQSPAPEPPHDAVPGEPADPGAGSSGAAHDADLDADAARRTRTHGHGRRFHRSSRAHLRDSVRPSPARAEPHDSATWLPLPDLTALPELEGLIATESGATSPAADPAAPPSPARARPHDPSSWLPLPDPGALPSIDEMLTHTPWDLHDVVRPSPARAEPHDPAAWLPLAAMAPGAPGGPGEPGDGAVATTTRGRRRGWLLALGLLVVATVVVAGTVLPHVAGSAYTVTLDADGQRRVLDTSAGSVADLLSERGVTLGPSDRVVPGPGASLAGLRTVTVLRAFPVTVDLDGTITTVDTTYTEPTEFVRRGLRQGDRVSIRSGPARLESGSTIIVRTRHTGRLVVDGQTVDYDVAAHDLAELLAEYSVELGPEDRLLDPSGRAVTRDTALADGVRYEVVRVGRDLVYVDESYSLPDERRPDASMAVGQFRVQQGSAGSTRSTFQVTYRNGEEVERRLVSKVPTVVARPTITYYGTKADPMWDRIAQCESGGNWSVVDSMYSGGLGIYNGTWDAFGGRDFAVNAGLATREEQIIVAERIRAGVGISGWGCAHILGYVR